MLSDRIRVLQFLDTFGIGGTERQIVNLTRALDANRFRSYLGCLCQKGDLMGEVTDQGIPIAEYQINNLYNARAWRQRLRLLRDIKRQRIQLVHTYGFYANTFAIPAARLSGVPAIASIRDTGSVPLSPLQQHAQRMVCHFAHRVVVNAEAVRRHLIAQAYETEKIVVIHNGVDLTRFSSRSAGPLRQELGLPTHAPLVVVVARLIPMKGIEYFIEAAALVAGRVPDARFLVVGDDLPAGDGVGAVEAIGYRSKLEQYAAYLGLSDRVVFTGFRLDVPELLANSTVSVLPSMEGEGLPNAVLEAMAAGIPVVATTVGGNAEAVEDGETGFLVPPRDAAELARAICWFLVHPELAARFGATGRERVARYFSLDRCVRETEDLYASLLTSARRRSAPCKTQIRPAPLSGPP